MLYSTACFFQQQLCEICVLTMAEKYSIEESNPRKFPSPPWRKAQRKVEHTGRCDANAMPAVAVERGTSPRPAARRRQWRPWSLEHRCRVPVDGLCSSAPTLASQRRRFILSRISLAGPLHCCSQHAEHGRSSVLHFTLLCFVCHTDRQR